MRRFSKSLLLAGVVAMGGLAGCGDDVTVTEQKPIATIPRVTGVTVTPPATSVQIGRTVTLVANVSIDSGSLARTVTWATSAANVATVSAAGVVTGVAAGVAVITATSTVDATKQGTATVTVSPVDLGVRAVEVQPPSAILSPGQTLQAVANVDAAPGVARTVTWATSAAAVATVSATGVITAVAPGTAAITATSTVDPSVRGSLALTVRPAANATVSIQKVTANAGGLLVPVNLNVVTGQIEVTLNVDPGDQILDRVVIVLGTDTVAVQRFGAVTAIIDGVSAAVVPSEITLSVNTAEITNLTTGAVRFTNGPKTLKAVLFTRAPGGGTASVAATSVQTIILRNQSGFLGKVTLVGQLNANDQIGNRWGKGGLQVDAVPVLYGSTVEPFTVPTIASATASFGSAVCGAGGQRVSQMTASGSTFTSTFNNTDGFVDVTNVWGYEFQIATCAGDLNQLNQQAYRFGEVPNISAIGSDGNPVELANVGGGFPNPGGAGFLNDPYNPIVGGNQSTVPNQAFAIRLDNLAPARAGTAGVLDALDPLSPQGDGSPPIIDTDYASNICPGVVPAATPPYCPLDGIGATYEVGNRSNKWMNDAVKLATAYVDNELNGPYAAVDRGVSRQIIAGASQVTFLSRIGTSDGDADSKSPVADVVGLAETGPAALRIRFRVADKLANTSSALGTSMAIDRTKPILSFTNADSRTGTFTGQDVFTAADPAINAYQGIMNASDQAGAAGSTPSGFFNLTGNPVTSSVRRVHFDPASGVLTRWYCPVVGNPQLGTYVSTGTIDGGGCATIIPGQRTFRGPFAQSLSPAPIITDAYFFATGIVNDQAANPSDPGTFTLLYDNNSPGIGGIGYPSFLTGGSTIAFSVGVDDNVDLGAGRFFMSYPGALAEQLQFPDQTIGTFGEPLTTSGSLTQSVAFMRNLQIVDGAGLPTGASALLFLPTGVSASVSDVAGNASTLSTATINASAIQGGTAYAAGVFTFVPVNPPVASQTISRDGATTGLPLALTLQATVTAPTTATVPFQNPFNSRVDFWVHTGTNTWRFVGSSFTPSVTDNTVLGTRTWTFQTTWNPDSFTAPTLGAVYSFIAIGVNTTGDAIRSNAQGAGITVQP